MFSIHFITRKKYHNNWIEGLLKKINNKFQFIWVILSASPFYSQLYFRNNKEWGKTTKLEKLSVKIEYLIWKNYAKIPYCSQIKVIWFFYIPFSLNFFFIIIEFNALWKYRGLSLSGGGGAKKLACYDFF